LIANELADDIRNPKIKRAYETQAVVEFGKFLNVDQAVVYDPGQKKQVPSPELESKIKDYQSQHDLTPTGQLNYPTLRTASETTASNLERAAEKSAGDAATVR